MHQAKASDCVKLGNQATDVFLLFMTVGGADDIEHLSVTTFGRGIVGCVGQLSVGQIYDVELLQRAADGRNVDACQDVTDDAFLLNVP